MLTTQRLKCSTIQVKYIIKFGQNIDTYRRGIVAYLCSLEFRQYLGNVVVLIKCSVFLQNGHDNK
jgi:hypothetical protein